jgi:hypothetical protein
MGITDEEAKYICSKIDSAKIKEIRVANRQLSPNAITHGGMLYISRKGWDSLTILRLGDNSLI